ncbi:MAG TPA: hypothetical protein PKA17_08645 [Phenylobacterium sp.]|nr:hypothetical protein [Phenylobacterium sp.]
MSDPNSPESKSAGGKPDQLEHEAENRQEALIDEAVEESFPASDPPPPKRIP